MYSFPHLKFLLFQYYNFRSHKDWTNNTIIVNLSSRRSSGPAPSIFCAVHGQSPVQVQQFMAQGSLFAFPAELMTLIKHRPNSSSIIRSAAALDFPFLSACSACARRQLHVASATSLVTNVNGNLKWRVRERRDGAEPQPKGGTFCQVRICRHLHDPPAHLAL